MRYFSTPAVLASCLLATAEARFVMYYDQWHTTAPTDASIKSGIDHVILSFIPSTGPAWATPFVPVSTIKQEFGSATKVSLAIGGWGDNSGFDQACQTDSSRKAFASAVNTLLTNTGADGVDIDMEYPGGDGADWKTNPNSGKASQIETYPLLLQAIRDAIGTDKILSIAVPGKAVDMIAFTAETGPKIWPTVDMINVMSYDLMNRRDTKTTHHSSVQGSLDTINSYLNIGAPASKINLGVAYYAKYFTTASDCGTQILGCQTAVLENPTDGSDTGLSGAITFQSPPPDVPANIVSIWNTAKNNPVLDEQAGGAYYYDHANKIFLTWDTPEFVGQKFDKIVGPKGLGGVMAWSLGEDTDGYEMVKAMVAGVAKYGGMKNETKRAATTLATVVRTEATGV